MTSHTDAEALLKLADDLEWLALASNKDFALHNGRGKMTKASIAIRQAASQGSAGGERFEVQTGELNELDRAIGIFGRATTETHLDPSDRYDAVKHVRDYLFGLRERLLHSAQAAQVPVPSDANIVTGAMAIARSRGHDPDDPAPLTEMCTEDNAAVPWWMVFMEESEACLKAVFSTPPVSQKAPAQGLEAMIGEIYEG